MVITEVELAGRDASGAAQQVGRRRLQRGAVRPDRVLGTRQEIDDEQVHGLSSHAQQVRGRQRVSAELPLVGTHLQGVRGDGLEVDDRDRATVAGDAVNAQVQFDAEAIRRHQVMADRLLQENRRVAWPGAPGVGPQPAVQAPQRPVDVGLGQTGGQRIPPHRRQQPLDAATTTGVDRVLPPGQ